MCDLLSAVLFTLDMLYSASWAILSILLAKCLAGSGGTAFLGPSGITGANVQQEQTWLIGDDKHFTWNGTWAAADLTYQATDSEVAITIGCEYLLLDVNT